LLSVGERELTLNKVNEQKVTTSAITRKRAMLSKALFSMLDQKELFLLIVLTVVGCFILYLLIWMVRMILRRTEPDEKVFKEHFNVTSLH
jgi:hypothetical protein